jgi:enoyl-CoA hydratase/carnithine racemase
MSIRLEVVGRAGVITIDRAEAKNSIDAATDQALREVWPKVNGMDEISTIILTRAGTDSFCAGADIVTLLPILRERRCEC